MLHPNFQQIIDVRPSVHNKNRFISQLKGQKITHLMLQIPQKTKTNSPFQRMVIELFDSNIIRKSVVKFDIKEFKKNIKDFIDTNMVNYV